MTTLELIGIIACVLVLILEVVFIIRGRIDKHKLKFDIISLLVWIFIYFINIKMMPPILIVLLPILWIIYFIVILVNYKMNRWIPDAEELKDDEEQEEN